MQSVSQDWKDNQNNQLVSESFVEIVLDMVDPEASTDASAVDNGSEIMSNTERIIKEVETEITPYATFEQNLWVLDGSKQIISSDNIKDCGYVGNVLSDANGVFSVTPVITIAFEEVHYNPLNGVTITWGKVMGDYPTSFTITAYNGGTVVAEKTITNNVDVKTAVFIDVPNYDSIKISIHEWCLPYRRARVEEVVIGVKMSYTKDNIISFNHSMENDLVASSLPKNMLSFSIDNRDMSFDPNGLTGLSKYLVEGQEISVKYGYQLDDRVEWINSGTFYLSRWETTSHNNQVDYEATSLLSLLNMTYNQGKYYENGRSLYDLAIDVLTFANLPLSRDGNPKWVIDESLKDIITTAPLYVDTVANCLQLIANAGCCIMYVDRNDVLHIEKHEAVVNDYTISQDNSFNDPDITLSPPLKKITIPVYSYSPEQTEDEDGEIISVYNTIYEGEYHVSEGAKKVNGKVEVTFTTDSPMVKFLAKELTMYTATVVSSNAYNCVVSTYLPSSNIIKLRVRGNKLIQSRTESVIDVNPTGYEITVDNYLITSEQMAFDVGEWVKMWLNHRQTQSVSWRADPRLDTLDLIDNETNYGNSKMLVTKIDYTYNGAFRGTAEGRVM